MKPLRPLTSWRPRESSCWVLLEILRALSTTGCSPSAETSRLVHLSWPHTESWRNFYLWSSITTDTMLLIPVIVNVLDIPKCFVLCSLNNKNNVSGKNFKAIVSVNLILSVVPFCVNVQLRQKSIMDNGKRKYQFFLTWTKGLRMEDFMLCRFAKPFEPDLRYGLFE